MATITFRTDDAVDQALRALSDGRGDRSQVIREAILDAWRNRQDDVVREQAIAIANDPEDRAEVRAILEEMESLRAW